ncbi:MAG TPA: Na+/H+ antiporter subunit E [Steroidobacteraceae bacterium]|nr:Na+/H+ antiporter subunit E [Steroidobacteraceae bacterium]HRX89771.1 Na+/H+ antiporter subunit E [Steroidobacteraceae bacterium]
MKHWLPTPYMSLVILVFWLLLNSTVAPAQVLLGALLAVILPLSLRAFWPPAGRIGSPAVIAVLVARVLLDIVVASIDVARRILGPERELEPRFIWVPIDLANPLAVEALAGIVTLTPGTLTADVTEDRRYLLVHAFDVDDEQAVIALIRERYEEPLRLIFPRPPDADKTEADE